MTGALAPFTYLVVNSALHFAMKGADFKVGNCLKARLGAVQ